MAINKEKKRSILDRLEEIKDQLTGSVVFVRFRGLGSEEANAVRRSLREEGVNYWVVKKTLLRRAFKDSFTGPMPDLEGEIAVAYGSDPLSPPQSIKTASSQYKDQISIVGGVFEGEYKNQAEMTEIASIPALPVLRGMFVNIINSPRQRLVMALSQIAQK